MVRHDGSMFWLEPPLPNGRDPSSPWSGLSFETPFTDAL
jgi:hypothetical protein